MASRKWLNYALARDWSVRVFCIRDYVEMCAEADCPLSDSRLYNAVHTGQLQATCATPKIKIKYSAFVAWFDHDPLLLLCQAELALQKEGRFNCPHCSEPLSLHFKVCPVCTRPNSYLSAFKEKQKNTQFDSSGIEIPRAS